MILPRKHPKLDHEPILLVGFNSFRGYDSCARTLKWNMFEPWMCRPELDVDVWKIQLNFEIEPWNNHKICKLNQNHLYKSIYFGCFFRLCFWNLISGRSDLGDHFVVPLRPCKCLGVEMALRWRSLNGCAGFKRFGEHWDLRSVKHNRTWHDRLW